jgi:RNA polymerase sigma factor (sigma-70 family)
VIEASLSVPSAFAAVFERHFAAVHRYSQQRVGVDAADEIASETFLQAFDNRSRFDVRQPSARPWLLGIATNLMRRRWRDERRQLAAYAETLQGAADDVAIAAPRNPGLDDDLAAALVALTRDDRDTLLLFVWADLSYQEIADALAVPVGTVRSRISRARRRLRDDLGTSRASAPGPANAPGPTGDCSAPRPPYVHTALAEEPHHG